MIVGLGIKEIDSSFYESPVCRTFKTSLEVIQKVMNVPFCALESLLRQHKKEIVERTSICIDEKMLDIFADAYVRKMKNYFRNSTRHVSQLSVKEFEVLNSFYDHFKKGRYHVNRLRTWEDIDENLIRETFIEEVKENTPQQECVFKRENNIQFLCRPFFIDTIKHAFIEKQNVLDISDKDGEFFSQEKILKALSLCCRKYEDKRILKKITHDVRYQSKHIISRVPKNFRKVFISLRFLFVSARYRMYSADGKEDSDTHYGIIVLDNCLS